MPLVLSGMLLVVGWIEIKQPTGGVKGYVSAQLCGSCSIQLIQKRASGGDTKQLMPINSNSSL